MSDVIKSAFGFGGQKCSACSRVIVLNDVYSGFVERLVDAVESLRICSPLDPSANYGPLIDQAAVAKSRKYTDIGMKEATPLVIRKDVPSKGWFVGPAVFGDVPANSAIAHDEIFGPVLSVMRAKNLDEAIFAANNCHYALTGGIYSRTPSSVQKYLDRILAGNVYVNRGITGAIVERQPFGGFKRSGLGSAKAGSREILRELALPQAVSENIVRHGFSPDMRS